MKRWWNVLKEQVLVFREKRQVQEVLQMRIKFIFLIKVFQWFLQGYHFGICIIQVRLRI